MANIIELAQPQQGLDVRFNMAFPPVVPSGALNAARIGPFYAGCGAPGARCAPGAPLPESVETLRSAVRGQTLNGLVDAYLGGLGSTSVTLSNGQVVQVPEIPTPIRIIWMASVGISAFHGYRRSGGSLGWTLGWALLGSIFPVITPAVALAQGLGQRKKA